MMRQWTQVPPLLKFTKSNISLQFVWKISLEMPNCHVSNIFIFTKAPDWIKRLIQKWIIRTVVVAIRHNIKIYPTIQCKFLKIFENRSTCIGTYWMQCIEDGLSFFSVMIYWYTCLSVEANIIVGLLVVLKKTN